MLFQITFTTPERESSWRDEFNVLYTNAHAPKSIEADEWRLEGGMVIFTKLFEGSAVYKVTEAAPRGTYLVVAYAVHAIQSIEMIP